MARSRSRGANRRAFRPGLLLAALVVVLLGLGGALWYLLHERRDLPAAGKAAPAELADRLRSIAERRGAREVVADDPIRTVDGVFVRSWRVSLPDREAMDGMAADVVAEATSVQAKATEIGAADPRQRRLRVDAGIEAFEITLAVQGRRPADRVPEAPPRPSPTPTRRPEPPPGARGRLAVILDDGGQRLDAVAPVAALPAEVAVSVLPFLPSSAEVAAAVHESGHEVWLHLPMQADGDRDQNPGPGAVLLSMTEAEIRSTVHAALNSVPHAVGVNNHMGSRATTELKVMTWVMQELKARGVAFIDSRTAVDTVAELAARSQGVPTNRRHVFLDNSSTRSAIRRQLNEAVYICRTEGEAIAIGHVTSPTTLEVLAEELPRIAERGADLVPPSALVR